jgi:radical SAM superfamily enzyme with C-terminal helix-hairpin-helix motif
MTSDAWILDGYIDEPACFGVPPYISPYVRYIAGALAEHGCRAHYCTIDQLRSEPGRFSDLNAADIVVMIAGVTVPGKYLGGTPASLTEIRQIGGSLHRPTTFIGGPITYGYAPQGGKQAVRPSFTGFDVVLTGESVAALENSLAGGEPYGCLAYEEIDRWSVRGAAVIRHHPSYPHVMCELETARGCSRAITGGCSFCTEPFYGLARHRSAGGIIAEVAALAEAGARHFRLGRQPDLLTYAATGGEFPRPRPDALEALFSGIRKAAPRLSTLHIDNINPGTIAHHEDAAREALRVIVAHHTAGDVGAFGMETADPVVIRENNLKAYPGDVLRAIEIVNEEGGGRRDGIPELLPGLNFVIGLKGETPATFEHNAEFLREVLDRDLLVRRINIRQLMPFEGTPAYEDNTLGQHETEFRAFKTFVRNEIDQPMLRRVFPAGTVLKDVIIEEPGNITFGRPMGSYPILAGFPLDLPVRCVTDAAVVDWGHRSVTALPVPVRINDLPLSALRWIPGVGKKKAALIALRRPFSSIKEFREVAGTTCLDMQLVF